jgi:PAS domain S-box-containing protein
MCIFIYPKKYSFQQRKTDRMDHLPVHSIDTISDNKNTHPYTSAYTELEKIMADIDTDLISETVDTGKVKRAFELLKVCRKNYHPGSIAANKEAECSADKEVNDAIPKSDETDHHINSLVANAPFPICLFTGKEMRVAFANNAALDLWGKGNDIIGKVLPEIQIESDGSLINMLDSVFTTGTPIYSNDQLMNYLVDGEQRSAYFNYSFIPLHDANGAVYAVMGTAVDVTDLNMAKQKAEFSERNFHNMFFKAPIAVCLLTGPNYVIKMANELKLELWGKTAEEVIDKPVFEVFPYLRGQGLDQLLQHVMETGETYTASERPLHGRLYTLYQNLVYAPFRDESGAIVGVLAQSIEVTTQVMARQKIEEVVAARTKELVTLNQELKKSNAELEQFAYIASHDLQEPLRKVNIFSEIFEKNFGEMDEQSKFYLRKINDATLRMRELIDDVLAYSQLKGNVVFTEVNLKNIVDNIINDFEISIGEKNATIVYNDLPVIEASESQLSQLFTNLISNALKFSKAEASCKININAQLLTKEELAEKELENAGCNYYRIEVKDNGIGFDQQYAEKIFTIFQRLHGKADILGTGIGLAMCDKIIQNHKGKIYATSSLGRGATFTIILPQNQLKVLSKPSLPTS